MPYIVRSILTSYSGADSRDDAAVAPDKAALLPGQVASFSNVTSDARGISGVMVDLADVPGASTLAAGDFTFRMGTSADPGTWSAAPAPSHMTVRVAGGLGGSNRVSMVWGERSIRNVWLQVTILANARTGLAAPDVFYFGKLPGETGDPAAPARVTTADFARVRLNLFRPAAIDGPYDLVDLGVGNTLGVLGAFLSDGTSNIIVTLSSESQSETARMSSSQPALLAGSLSVYLANGFKPAAGVGLELLTFPSAAGSLSLIDGDPGDGDSLDLTQHPTNVTMTFR